MKLMQWARVCLLVGMGLLLCVPAFAQTTGEIRGGVSDQSGAVIQGSCSSRFLTMIPPVEAFYFLR